MIASLRFSARSQTIEFIKHAVSYYVLQNGIIRHVRKLSYALVLADTYKENRSFPITISSSFENMRYIAFSGGIDSEYYAGNVSRL
jgi:hypothetical protein